MDSYRQGKAVTTTLFQRDSQLTPECKYLQNISLWLFPQGPLVYDTKQTLVRSVSTFESQEQQRLKSTNHQVMHFVMTDEHQTKRYCSALMVYQLRTLSGQSVYLPFQLCLVSKVNMFAFCRHLFQQLALSLFSKDSVVSLGLQDVDEY